MEETITIVILAAGLGTRMRSRKAKVLHEAGGLRLIEHVVNAAASVAPADNIAVVVGHQAEQVQAVLAGRGLRFAVQTQQLGTGDALAVSRGVIASQKGLLVVLYGDTPLLEGATIAALVQNHRASVAAATVITT